MVNMKIEEIEGIGPVMAAKLKEAAVFDTDGLLETCCTRKGRKTIAELTGLSEKLVLKWANMADLFRVKGVGSEYADLLERSGVDTVKELRTRNAENLATKMVEVNEEKKLTRQTPSAKVVDGWIQFAKELDPRIEH